jgi:hypothetical protein
MIRGLMKKLPRPYPNYVVHSTQYQIYGPTGPTHAHSPTHKRPDTIYVPTDMQVLLASGDVWSPNREESKSVKK